MADDKLSGDGETMVIAYGSNLPSGTRTASQAFRHLVKTLAERGLIITKISRLWQSRAWPNPDDPPYVNAVVLAESSLPPEALLHLLHDVERDAGRVRDGRRNTPRVLDLDLIAYGDRVIDGPGLVLPHPRAAERGFVMGPLAEVAPDWLHPVLKSTAAELYRGVSVGQDAYPLD